MTALYPKIIRGTYFLIMLGDAATTEVFNALCGITTRDYQYTAKTNDQHTRDCNDPASVPVRNLIVTGESWALTGDGLLNRTNIATIEAAKGKPRHWRFVWTEPTGDTVYAGYYGGTGILTSMKITGGDEQFAGLQLTIESDGPWIWTVV